MENRNKIYTSMLIILTSWYSMAQASSTTIAADKAFPWWYQKLLSFHMAPWLVRALEWLNAYLPAWAVKLLEEPWTIAYIVAAFVLLRILIYIWFIIKFIKERRYRKKAEAEYALLFERYEQLKLTHAQHHALVTAMLTHKVLTLSDIYPAVRTDDLTKMTTSVMPNAQCAQELNPRL